MDIEKTLRCAYWGLGVIGWIVFIACGLSALKRFPL